jgi:hypothetical protein
MCFGTDGTTVLPEPGAPARTDMSAVLAMYKALIAEPPKTAWLVATGGFHCELVVNGLAHKSQVVSQTLHCCSTLFPM